MDVTGPGSVQGGAPISPAQQGTASRPAGDVDQVASPRPVRDEVEISPAGRLMDDLSRSSDVRAERLARIRAEIEAGTYETPEKLEAALANMLRDLGLRDEESDRR